MIEPKFTQGPWSDCRGSIGLFDEYGEYEIADVLMTCTGMTLEEWRANCRLIVTAPEMYALLKKHQAECGGSSNYGSCSACRDRESCELTNLLARINGEESK